MTMTPFVADNRRARLVEKIAVYEEAAKACAEAAVELPDYWEHPTCCDNQNLQFVEHGYLRWEEVETLDAADSGLDLGDDEVGEPYMHASTDGWDSMSEHGSFEYIECNPHNGGCGATWAIPENLEWD